MANRILMYMPRVWGGGLETSVFEEALLFSRWKWDVTLICHKRFCASEARQNALRQAAVRRIELPFEADVPAALRVVTNWLRIRSVLGSQRFELVVGHGLGGSHSALKRFVAPGGKFVWHDHMYGTDHSGEADHLHDAPASVYPWKVRRSVLAADIVITGSKRGERNLRTVQGVTAPVHVLPALRRLDSIGSAVERRVGNSTLRLAVFGHLNAQKGIRPLLELWDSLDIGDSTLTFHGADPGGDFERLARLLCRRGNVEFRGAYSDTQLLGLMADVDLGLITSLGEGTPITALEFMACGVPFVTTNVGAAPEFTANNPDALLAELNPWSVSRAIENMVSRVREGQTSRARLQQFYRHNYSFELLAERYWHAMVAPLGDMESAGAA